MIGRRAVFLAALLTVTPSVAVLAQSDDRTQSTPVRPSEPQPRGNGVGNDASGGGEGSSLSDTLSRSGGVVTPPRTGDEKGVKGPPPEGRMPVIPPPGTPGNDRGVEPK